MHNDKNFASFIRLNKEREICMIITNDQFSSYLYLYYHPIYIYLCLFKSKNLYIIHIP